jgi:hypothetical protein
MQKNTYKKEKKNHRHWPQKKEIETKQINK